MQIVTRCEILTLVSLEMRLFRTVSTALGELSTATGRLAEDSSAGAASDDSLSVGEHSGHLETALAADIHEETAGSRDKLLQLVLLRLALSARVEDIDSQNHFRLF